MRYIGGKSLLLDSINKVITQHCKTAKVLCDIFSGTSVVARYFKPKYEVLSNDVLYFSYCLQVATIEAPHKPRFKKLKETLGITDPVKFFNEKPLEEMENLEQAKRFCQNNYSPNGGRMYLTDSNALRIDYARNMVEKWNRDGLLDKYEYYYLIAAIVEGVPFVSNISGTYGAFHKQWDRRTSKTFQLIDLEVLENGLDNKAFNDDGIHLLETIRGDILYIDPPYNERQYLPNYHLLETVAKYDFPILKGITGQRAYGMNQKSDFCSLKTVYKAFERLMQNAKFEHIILSYNTDGIMSVDEIERIMKKYGIPDTFEIHYIDYRRYKSKSNVTNTSDLKEMLIYIRKEVSKNG